MCAAYHPDEVGESASVSSLVCLCVCYSVSFSVSLSLSLSLSLMCAVYHPDEVGDVSLLELVCLSVCVVLSLSFCLILSVSFFLSHSFCLILSVSFRLPFSLPLCLCYLLCHHLPVSHVRCFFSIFLIPFPFFLSQYSLAVGFKSGALRVFDIESTATIIERKIQKAAVTSILYARSASFPTVRRASMIACSAGAPRYSM